MGVARPELVGRLGGRADRSQVESRLARRAAPLAPEPSPEPSPEPTAVLDRPPAGLQVVPFTAIRRATAVHVAASRRTAAHALLVTEVDYGSVEAARHRAGLTYLPFVARAVVDAIADHPLVNGRVVDDGVAVHPEVHLGIAVDLDHEGLVVPVVHGAGEVRLRALATRIADLAGRARAGRLTVADVEGGTFTLTNVGSRGTVSSAPIVNHPQVAILSTDGVRPRPVAVPHEAGYAVAVRPVGNLSFSFDHRAFDGAYAASFLTRVRALLEEHDWEAELG